MISSLLRRKKQRDYLKKGNTKRGLATSILTILSLREWGDDHLSLKLKEKRDYFKTENTQREGWPPPFLVLSFE